MVPKWINNLVGIYQRTLGPQLSGPVNFYVVRKFASCADGGFVGFETHLLSCVGQTAAAFQFVSTENLLLKRVIKETFLRPEVALRRRYVQ